MDSLCHSGPVLTSRVIIWLSDFMRLSVIVGSNNKSSQIAEHIV